MSDTETTFRHPTLAAALSAFQEELPTIRKGNEAKVKSERTGAEYKYNYADLTDVSEVALPLLAKHGLAWTAQPTLLEEMFVLHYELKHESGESIEGIYPLPSWTTPPQQLGSAITYARRYALTAVTGVAPGGDDDDAASAPAAEKTVPTRTRKAPAAKAQAAPVFASTNWAAEIVDAKTIDELRLVHERASTAGELGLVLDPKYETHLAGLAGMWGLNKPNGATTAAMAIQAVKQAMEETASGLPLPGEDEYGPAGWPTATPGGEPE